MRLQLGRALGDDRPHFGVFAQKTRWPPVTSCYRAWLLSAAYAPAFVAGIMRY